MIDAIVIDQGIMNNEQTDNILNVRKNTTNFENIKFQPIKLSEASISWDLYVLLNSLFISNYREIIILWGLREFIASLLALFFLVFACFFDKFYSGLGFIRLRLLNIIWTNTNNVDLR